MLYNIEKCRRAAHFAAPERPNQAKCSKVKHRRPGRRGAKSPPERNIFGHTLKIRNFALAAAAMIAYRQCNIS